ncbi:MAG: hypothetical protein AAGE43_17100 [Pseudomonadota bacterium]
MKKVIATLKTRVAAAAMLPLLLGFSLAVCSPSIQAEFDTRAHTDLNPVIMLCATAPGSPRFQAAWQRWLKENPGADVAGAVETVISRSGTVRSMAVPGMTPTGSGHRVDHEAIAAQMFSLAGLPVPG